MGKPVSRTDTWAELFLRIRVDFRSHSGGEAEAAQRSHIESEVTSSASARMHSEIVAVDRFVQPFRAVRWSTEHALADTEANVHGASIGHVRTLDDVDTAVNVPCTNVHVSDVVSLLLRGAEKVALAAPKVVPLTCSAKFGKVGDAVVGRVALDI